MTKPPTKAGAENGWVRYTQAMRKQATVVTVTVALLLALTGCGEEAPESAPVGFANTEASAETPAPLVAEKPEASTDNAESDYLVKVRDRIAKIQTQIPNATDAQLLEAGYAACERIEAGISGEDWSIIEGETMTNGYYMDSAAISGSARTTLCPAVSQG